MELTYRIDCRELTSRAAAHDCFARVFALPAFYGRNLDALYDVLTELPPCTLLLEHTGCLYDALGPYAEKLLGVFRDAARENPNIQIQEDIKTFLSIFSYLVYIARKQAFFLVRIVNLQSAASSDKIRNMNEL